jgi:hypothetical protein
MLIGETSACANFIVEGNITVELKALINLENVHLAQAKNYVLLTICL